MEVSWVLGKPLNIFINPSWSQKNIQFIPMGKKHYTPQSLSGLSQQDLHLPSTLTRNNLRVSYTPKLSTLCAPWNVTGFAHQHLKDCLPIMDFVSFFWWLSCSIFGAGVYLTRLPFFLGKELVHTHIIKGINHCMYTHSKKKNKTISTSLWFQRIWKNSHNWFISPNFEV